MRSEVLALLLQENSVFSVFYILNLNLTLTHYAKVLMVIFWCNLFVVDLTLIVILSFHRVGIH